MSEQPTPRFTVELSPYADDVMVVYDNHKHVMRGRYRDNCSDLAQKRADELNRRYALEAEYESTKRLPFGLTRAIALLNTLAPGWDDPDGWDYGLSPDELGDRKRDGHRVQRLWGLVWSGADWSEDSLRDLPAAYAARFYRASKLLNGQVEVLAEGDER